MNSKRKLLLALSGLSAATVWEKPIIKAVVLPAHAQTSPCSIRLSFDAHLSPSYEIKSEVAFLLFNTDRSFFRQFIGATEDTNIVLTSGVGHIYHLPANESISLDPGTYTLKGAIVLELKSQDLTDLTEDPNGKLVLFECDNGLKILDKNTDRMEAGCMFGESAPVPKRVNARQIPRQGRGEVTVRVSSCGADASESVTIAGNSNSPKLVGRLIEFDIVVSEDGGYSIKSRFSRPAE